MISQLFLKLVLLTENIFHVIYNLDNLKENQIQLLQLNYQHARDSSQPAYVATAQQHLRQFLISNFFYRHTCVIYMQFDTLHSDVQSAVFVTTKNI